VVQVRPEISGYHGNLVQPDCLTAVNEEDALQNLGRPLDRPGIFPPCPGILRQLGTDLLQLPRKRLLLLIDLVQHEEEAMHLE
jgi:hypothetical protein